jgi:hypothetical protein
MKTYILQLEPHDDIISVRDKMNWAASARGNARILLVWPEARKLDPSRKLLARRLDLTLVQRHGAILGAQLGLATRDPEVRYQALRLGIPVFKTLRKAQRPTWRVPRRFRFQIARDRSGISEPGINSRESDRPGTNGGQLPTPPPAQVSRLSPLVRATFFTLGVLALLSIAATLAPRALISLTPQTRVQEVVIDAWTAESVGSVEAGAANLSGAVPSRQATVIVEGRDSLTTSGSILLPDQAAIASIVFTNLTDQPVDIPLGTVVRGQGENPARFSITRLGTLEAGPGITLTLPARALAPGSQGNLPAHTLTAIEGLLGTQVSADNPQPSASGSDRQMPAPSAEDRRQLVLRLGHALEQTALSEVENDLAQGDLLIPSSLSLSRSLDESFQPAENEPADRLTLNMRLEYHALVVEERDLRALAQAVFDANLAEGFTPLPDSLAVEVMTVPEIAADGAYHWQLHGTRQILAQFSAAQVTQLALGQPVEQARARLATALSLESPPQIALIPDWWPRLPILPFRIQVIQAVGDNEINPIPVGVDSIDPTTP